jgi:hypothetical protein
MRWPIGHRDVLSASRIALTRLAFGRTNYDAPNRLSDRLLLPILPYAHALRIAWPVACRSRLVTRASIAALAIAGGAPTVPAEPKSATERL